MTRDLYLIRHGQTLFNAMDKSQGWCDSPLTQIGIEQTHTAAAHLKELNLPFDHFCCSTSERASDTLELIMRDLYDGELRPYVRHKGLKECYYGSYEAVTLAILAKLIDRDDDSCVPFGGEPFPITQQRMVETLTNTMQEEGHTCVLAVSHMLSSLLFADAVQAGLRDELAPQFNNCAYLHFAFDTKTNSFKFLEVVQTNDVPSMSEDIATH